MGTRISPWLLTVAWVGAAVQPGLAQSTKNVEDMLPQSELDDPIGVDRSSRALETAGVTAAADPAHVRRERERFGPMPPAVRATTGEVLTANRAVRETGHAVDVRIVGDLAVVETRLRFETAVETPAEVRYRLAVGDDSGLAALEVCNAAGCRQGLQVGADGASAYDDSLHARGADSPLPIADARLARDARGAAIVVRAAPVTRGAPLDVKLRHVTPVSVRGGRARLFLPPRGMDPRAAPAELRFEPGRWSAPQIGATAGIGPARVDPWEGVELSVRVAPGERPRGHVWTFPCGKSRCVRASLMAGTAPPEPVDLVIALDVSPSTEGPARGRLLSALSALLSAAPDGSRVRALSFAGTAEALVPRAQQPMELPLAPFGRAIERGELGSATRFEAAWALLETWLPARGERRLRPVVVIVGDGGLTVGEARPFAEARRRGVQVSVLNVADRASVEALAEGAIDTGGVVVDAGAEADEAARGRGSGALEERVAAFFAPTVATQVKLRAGGRSVSLGNLRAGESLSWEGRGPTAVLSWTRGRSRAKRAPDELSAGLWSRLATTPPALAAVDPQDLSTAGQGWAPPPSKRRCDARGPSRRHGGISSDAAPVALAEARACRKKPPPAANRELPIGVGMPSDPLLDMLRQRVVPVARGCFRRDRAGRADYSVRAVFHFTLAEREVVSARVEGKIGQALRRCLLQAIDGLDVPRFSGTVNVRYPLRTIRERQPPVIELSNPTAREVDRLLGGKKRSP